MAYFLSIAELLLMGCLLPAELAGVSAWAAADVTKFEVATIKPSLSDSRGSNLNLSIGHVSANNVTLKFLLQFAYHLNSGSEDQISGGPAWLRSATFDLDAKEDEALASKLEKLSPDERTETLRQMLQALLADRFGLKFHYATRMSSVIALTASRRGTMLKPSQDTPERNGTTAATSQRWGGLHNNGNGEVEGRGATLDMLVNVLASQPEIGGRIVVNETGMTGKYDFTLKWTPDRGSGASAGTTEADGTGPSLFAAVQEQLGLKLESRRAPLRVLVIDSVEKPSEN